MSHAGRKPKQAPPPRAAVTRPDTDLKLREFAKQSVELAIQAWEYSNAADALRQHWMQQAWFLLRELKNHPKLVNASPQLAAEYVQALYQQVPEVRDVFEGDNLLEGDVLTYVVARWGRIATGAGACPLTTAVQKALVGPVTWTIEASHFEAVKKYKAFIRYDSFQRKWEYANLLDEERKKSFFHSFMVNHKFETTWEKLHYNPAFAKVICAVWCLHQLLVSNEKNAEPVLLLPCPKLGDLLGLSHTTVWTHRQSLEDRNLIVRQPKRPNELADRFKVNDASYSVFLLYMASEDRREKPKIDLD